MEAPETMIGTIQPGLFTMEQVKANVELPTLIGFKVIGTPIPQGSLKPINIPGRNYTVLIPDNKRCGPWKKDITKAAKALGIPMIMKPDGVLLTLDFFFERPVSVKEKHRPLMTVKPDLDKLTRAIKDAFSKVIYEDDAQVVSMHVNKCYGSPARVEIRIGELNADTRKATGTTEAGPLQT